MTDTTQAQMSADEAFGRALVARKTFEREAIWLPQLAVHHWNAGEMAIEGKTFTDCVIEGPAVMAVMHATAFENCAMGTTTDVRTLLFRPVGEKMAGVVGVSNCTFVRCRFVQIGFTGTDELLKELETGILPKSLTEASGTAS